MRKELKEKQVEEEKKEKQRNTKEEQTAADMLILRWLFESRNGKNTLN